MDINDYIRLLRDRMLRNTIRTIDLIATNPSIKQQYDLFAELLSVEHSITELKLENFALSYRTIRKLREKGIKNIHLKNCVVIDIPDDERKFFKTSKLIWAITFEDNIHFALTKDTTKKNKSPLTLTEQSDLVEAILEDSKKDKRTITKITLTNFSLTTDVMLKTAKKYYPEISISPPPKTEYKPTSLTDNCMSTEEDKEDRPIGKMFASLRGTRGKRLPLSLPPKPCSHIALPINTTNAGLSNLGSPQASPSTLATSTRQETSSLVELTEESIFDKNSHSSTSLSKK